MFDEVHCEADLPPGHPETNRDFQTKSLASCLDRFTITKEGRLIFHAVRYEASDEPGLKFPMKAVHVLSSHFFRILLPLCGLTPSSSYYPHFFLLPPGNARMRTESWDLQS